jgi:hypothetical protein
VHNLLFIGRKDLSFQVDLSTAWDAEVWGRRIEVPIFLFFSIFVLYNLPLATDSLRIRENRE